MMKRQILSISLVLTLALGLSGCSCKHQWKDATCTTPATCAKCGETAGSPLGHNWKDATCTQLETCSVCGATNGQPLDHQWQEATCTQPKTCSVCGATNGQPIDHQWLPATCTEPETCSVCGETQGEAPAGHVLDRNGVCTVCGEAVGTPLNMGNYTQYLNFFADYGTPKSEFYKESTYHKTSTTYYTYYERAIEQLTGSALGKKATEQQMKDAKADAYKFATRAGGEKDKERWDRWEAAGMDAGIYALYQLAEEMADKPNENGNLGTITNEEREAAIRSMAGLTDRERSALWKLAGGKEKSDPWR